MPTKTITIKRRYDKEGTGKKGAWHLTRLLGNDSNYYTTFKQVAEGIKEGIEVKLECSPTDKPDTFTITKIINYGEIDYGKDADSARHEEAEGAVSPPDEASLSHEEAVAGRLHKAKLMLCKEFTLEEHEVNPDSLVLAEILRQLYGEIWLKKEIKWQ